MNYFISLGIDAYGFDEDKSPRANRAFYLVLEPGRSEQCLSSI
jgi:hypothetical protein